MNQSDQLAKIDKLFKRQRLYSETLKTSSVPDLSSLTMTRAIFRNGDLTVYLLRSAFKISIEGKEASVEELERSESVSFQIDCPFDFLSTLYKSYRSSIEPMESLSPGPQPAMIGYLGFGLTESSLGIPRQTKRFANLPDAIMEIPSLYLVSDAGTGQIRIVSDSSIEECARIASLIEEIDEDSEDLEEFSPGITKVEVSISDQEYEKKVEEVKGYISEGESFQIVLSRRFSADLNQLSPRDLFRRILKESGSPYSYFFDYGNFQYLGASPESCISLKNGIASFRALAGTRPRGSNSRDEERMEEELVNCAKERAEHMMLVDLGRNDLGRVCQSGTVKVKDLMKVVKYPQVMHLSTDLEGKLEEPSALFETVRSCFPRGTVSGAPKKRALEILSRLEPEQRGIYSGAVGVIDLNEKVDLAIAIRSATIVGKRLHVQAGAGIVYDSVPGDERKETENKASSILSLLNRSWRSLKCTKPTKQPVFSGAKENDNSSNRQL